MNHSLKICLRNPNGSLKNNNNKLQTIYIRTVGTTLQEALIKLSH